MALTVNPVRPRVAFIVGAEGVVDVSAIGRRRFQGVNLS
jgi:hypothetical protein